jgi:hypothetical protein
VQPTEIKDKKIAREVLGVCCASRIKRYKYS